MHLDNGITDFSRAFVFRVLEIGGQEHYMHFDLDDDKHLVPSSLLSEEEHQELLAYE